MILRRGLVALLRANPPFSRPAPTTTNAKTNNNNNTTTHNSHNTLYRYDCILRQARLQGRVDTNGVVSCFVTERFGPLNFLLSAEVDHGSRNYKFGFGFTLGE